MAKHGNELILTKDPDIYFALAELGFKDCLGVPMSNGGVIVDNKQREAFENMKYQCARKADAQGQKKRTAAVQRGDIITTYDPNDKGSDGVYRNVRHYEIGDYGTVRAISMYEASNKLQMNKQHGANEVSGISISNSLDRNTANKFLEHIRYNGK